MVFKHALQLPPKSRIRTADFGQTNLGRLKGLYRSGLAERYGKEMQTICAIHYNFSFNEFFGSGLNKRKLKRIDKQFKSRRYFDLMRNFRRYSWLLTYLFGASPAACASFIKTKNHELLKFFNRETVFSPYSTSLRSADIGYQSGVQSEHVTVSYNGLAQYVSSLKAQYRITLKVTKIFKEEISN